MSYKLLQLSAVAASHQPNPPLNTFPLSYLADGPRFECDQAPSAFVADENVTMTCRLDANPPVTAGSVRWRFSLPIGENDTLQEATLEAGGSAEEGAYSATAQVGTYLNVLISLVL